MLPTPPQQPQAAWLSARASPMGAELRNRGWLIWEELSCYVPGVLLLTALRGLEPIGTEAEAQVAAARAIAHGCLRLHSTDHPLSALGLAPEMVFVKHATDASSTSFKIYSQERGYRLRPETVESLFYLSRLDPAGEAARQRWREHAWQIFEAIEAHCKVAAGSADGGEAASRGYTALRDVRRACVAGERDGRNNVHCFDTGETSNLQWRPQHSYPGTHERLTYSRSTRFDLPVRVLGWRRHVTTVHGTASRADLEIGQPSYFLAETLKYLLLIFSPPDVVPLDEFVSAIHPAQPPK
jgi:hypothetical protein